jgi:hypothetical protein
MQQEMWLRRKSEFVKLTDLPLSTKFLIISRLQEKSSNVKRSVTLNVTNINVTYFCDVTKFRQRAQS